MTRPMKRSIHRPNVTPNIDHAGPRGFAWLFSPVDAASLAWFRIVFGAVMFWEFCSYVKSDWIGEYFIKPEFHFKFYGFEWVQPWPGDFMYLHFLVLGVASLGVLFGCFYRLSATLLAFGFTYVFLIDQAIYLNHLYLLSLVSFCMIFLPAHRTLSVDARRRPEIYSRKIPSWCLWLLRGQLGIVYFFGGVAKLNSDWLHGYPLKMWMPEMGHLPYVGALFQYEATALIFSYGGLLLDLTIFPLLLWRRTRIPAYALSVVFHLLNALMFQIGAFPWFMIAGTLIFFSPSWPRRLGIFAGRARTSVAVAAPARNSRRMRCVTVSALTIYLALQVILPLRHHFYPGDVSWTEEGHTFAWRMKLRQKSSALRFKVTYPDTRETVWVEPKEFFTLLTRVQSMALLHKPEMVRQLTHHLANKLQHPGGRRPEVRAWIATSLNGREHQLLVDPKVNLASKSPSLGHADWILPLVKSRPTKPPTQQADQAPRITPQPGVISWSR